MGFSPRQTDELSLWEFVACLDGFRGEGDKKAPAMSDERLRELGIEGF